MQITDMLSQYNRNLANGIEVSGGTQGIKEVVSSLNGMSVGNVFEGSINSVENGVVTLGLSDGKTIQARLDSGVSVKPGETMFFQVKSNSGGQIAIRPYSNGVATNPTLLNALEAANLQVSDKTLTMVNAMMEQSMSIDKLSLLNMAKLVMGNDALDVTSIVQMTKLGIPVTDEMAAQFENYKSDQYALLTQLESTMELLPEQLSSGSLSQKELLDFNQQMVRVFLGGEQGAESGVLPEMTGEMAAQESSGLPGQAGEMVAAQESNGLPGQPGEVASAQENGGLMGQSSEMAEPLQLSEAMQKSSEAQTILDMAQTSGETQENAVNAANMQESMSQTAENASNLQPDLLKNIFTGSELNKLFEQLGKIPELAQNSKVFQNGEWNTNLTSKELLQLLEQAFSSKNSFSREGLSELVSSKEYRTLIRNVMEQQWLLRPEELKTEHKVNELYERMDHQLNQMEKVLKSFGQNTPQLSDTASNVRSNIQFMNQINQTYAYVQIPLKMAGQNAHSDLYVYTDKRKIQEKDGELTAFLHLDMEHLGSTDVSIKLYQKKVTTNFYLDDDTSYQLVLEHLDILEKRLEEKGYNAKIQVINQDEKPNFVENLLTQGAPSAGGMVHRYSFDVRA